MEDMNIQINSGEEDNGDGCNKASTNSSHFEDMADTSALPELHLQSHIAKGIEKHLLEGLGKDSRNELSKNIVPLALQIAPVLILYSATLRFSNRLAIELESGTMLFRMCRKC
ncbi:hypothetical protein PoB_004528100 [Plakobranchus ocellatus]|uniref:Uncharacterized protein n=1 Tax=Plakobranchus ocellatus TaxID=259542 RepID=A0AAV4B5W0_9GAST|nr:hypothetical protein PoB_004528100 [Plakobranchus ocellatus]